MMPLGPSVRSEGRLKQTMLREDVSNRSNDIERKVGPLSNFEQRMPTVR